MKDLLSSFAEMVLLIERTADSCGGKQEYFGCDHSVGICACFDRRIYENAVELLEQAAGKEWRKFYAG